MPQTRWPPAAVPVPAVRTWPFVPPPREGPKAGSAPPVWHQRACASARGRRHPHHGRPPPAAPRHRPAVAPRPEGRPRGPAGAPDKPGWSPSAKDRRAPADPARAQPPPEAMDEGRGSLRGRPVAASQMPPSSSARARGPQYNLAAEACTHALVCVVCSGVDCRGIHDVPRLCFRSVPAMAETGMAKRRSGSCLDSSWQSCLGESGPDARQVCTESPPAGSRRPPRNSENCLATCRALTRNHGRPETALQEEGQNEIGKDIQGAAAAKWRKARNGRATVPHGNVRPRPATGPEAARPPRLAGTGCPADWFCTPRQGGKIVWMAGGLRWPCRPFRPCECGWPLPQARRRSCRPPHCRWRPRPE